MDYMQADLDEARSLAPQLNAKAQERIAKALRKREQLGLERAATVGYAAGFDAAHEAVTVLDETRERERNR